MVKTSSLSSDVPIGWKMEKLIDCLTRKPEYGINASSVKFSENLFTYIRITDISEDGYFIQENKTSVIHPTADKFILREGDIVFARTGASTGKSYLYDPEDGKLVFAGFLIRIVTNSKKLLPEFLKIFTETKTYWNWVKKTSTRSGQEGINGTEYSQLSLLVPPINEQKKIVNLISEFKKLIKIINSLMIKKKNIQLGTIQELLSGKKRLEGFSKKWKIKPMGDCLIKKPEYGINAPAVEYSYNLPAYIRITDISEDGRFLHKTKKSVNNLNSDQFILEDGDIVFARTGASTGKSYLYDPEDGKLVFAGFLIRCKIDSKKIIPQYLKKFTETKEYWNWVKKTSMRSGQPGINANEYSKLPVLIPDIEEQKIIAQILVDMDSEIKELETTRDKYIMIKEGMMQKLLPGEIRLV